MNDTQLTLEDVFADPVAYLQGLGIEAELVAESDHELGMAA